MGDRCWHREALLCKWVCPITVYKAPKPGLLLQRFLEHEMVRWNHARRHLCRVMPVGGLGREHHVRRGRRGQRVLSLLVIAMIRVPMLLLQRTLVVRVVVVVQLERVHLELGRTPFLGRKGRGVGPWRRIGCRGWVRRRCYGTCEQGGR